MNGQDRTGKAPTWVVALGGLVMAAVGPWGASTVWQTWKAPPSGSPAASADASSQGAIPAPQATDSSGLLSGAPYAWPNASSGGTIDVLPPSPPGIPPLSLETGIGDSPEKLPSAQEKLSFEEVFRFDLTIRDVLARWPRVSTSLPDLQLQGYRVPLVTGARETDLAGALTYYFNSYQQVQRITFQGTTGDGRELVQFLATRYGFQRRLTNDPSLFVYEVPRLGGPPQSTLRMKLAPTLKIDRPHQRFDVSLVLERPQEPPKSFWQQLGWGGN